ncbi:MAG: 1-deoxy-D-xylulose-5-phosphate synthase N-terminal domain-containing protein, partial [Gemmatimonadaceae bacterium]
MRGRGGVRAGERAATTAREIRHTERVVTPNMPILDRINSPADLKTLSRDELRALAEDIRERMIELCSRTGGHIGAGLGVVELT